MDKNIILKSEQYMIDHMKDSAHDKEHVYRVTNLALDIAKTELNTDENVLIVACLLHDLGRAEQVRNPKLCHAEVGADMAYRFLISEGVSENEAIKVKACIASHRFRSNHLLDSIESKILFDADTIDATGAMGIARSLHYEGKFGIPIYNTDINGNVIKGDSDTNESFLREYNFKLKNLYDRLYTKRGREIAENRRDIANKFYKSLHNEIMDSHRPLKDILRRKHNDIIK